MVDKESTNGRGRMDDEEEETPEGGRGLPPRLPCELEKDVVVVVGGEEFEENSTLLRCCSSYFDIAIRKERAKIHNSSSNTTTTSADPHEQLRFEFPNHNPREWRVIRELIRPFPIVKITLNNMPLILPWFDFLRISRGMEECDRILCDQLGGRSLKALAPQKDDQLDQLQEYLSLILEGLTLCCRYNNKTQQLRRSKMMLLGILGKVIQDHSVIIGLKECKSLCHFLKTDEECYQELWDKVSVYLPPSFIQNECATKAGKTTTRQTLPKTMNPIVFQKALYNGIQTHQSISELSWLERRALNWLQRPSPTKKKTKMVQQQQEPVETEEEEEDGNNNKKSTTTSSEQEQEQVGTLQQ